MLVSKIAMTTVLGFASSLLMAPAAIRAAKIDIFDSNNVLKTGDAKVRIGKCRSQLGKDKGRSLGMTIHRRAHE